MPIPDGLEQVEGGLSAADVLQRKRRGGAAQTDGGVSRQPPGSICKSADWDRLLSELAGAQPVTLTHTAAGRGAPALTHKVSVLTGGPGTGKTTTLRTVIGVLERTKHRFMLASPTGRAAKRLSEATGHPARTIHRMLGYSPPSTALTTTKTIRSTPI